MKKFTRMSVLIILTLFLISSTASAFTISWKDVWVTDNGNTTTYKTTKDSFIEFFESEGIILNSNDLINVNLYDEIRSDIVNKVNIDRFINVKVNIDLMDTKTLLANETELTDEFIERLEKETGLQYETLNEYPQELNTIDNLLLKTRSIQEFTIIEHIPFETEYVYSDQLLEGTQKTDTHGTNGEKEIIISATFYGGIEESREIINEHIITEPINKIVLVGTKKSPTKKIGNFTYTRELIMNASAYTAGFESTGKNPGDPGYGITASGMPVRHGVVAVDPNVIPLGTRLYVEGYGETIAADTGGSIKGHKIDLYYENLQDAINFGRRNVKVYVLE